MADRGPVIRVTPRSSGPRVVNRTGNGGGLGDLPPNGDQPEGPNTRDPSSRRSNRLSSGAAAREQTVHGANGAVPVHAGGPLPCGGYIIFLRKTPTKLFIDFAVGDGSELDWGYEEISNIKFGDKPEAQVNVTTEIHLGQSVADVTSTLISTIEPAYTIPPGIAHVACEFSWPNSVTGEYDPLDFKCTVKGLRTPNVDTEVVGYSRNIPRFARAMMIMAGMDPATDVIDADWILAQTIADVDLTAAQPQATPASTLAIGTGAGAVENGRYRVGFTWVTAGVESKISPWSNELVVDNFSSNRVLRSTAVAVGPGGTTARKIYRQKLNGGGSSWGATKLCGTIADNSTTIFQDIQHSRFLPDGEPAPPEGVIAWEMSGRIDSQDTLENQVGNVLDHCHGHLRHANGQYGVWLDEPRDVAVDNEAVPVKFKDFGDDANMMTEFVFTDKGRSEIPTVVTFDYPDAASDFVDASVSVPEVLAPGIDWIERRFSRPFTTARQQIIRDATKTYARLVTCIRDIAGTTWADGIIPLIGERCYLESRELLPSTTNVGNAVVWPVHAGSVDGIEEAVLVDKVERDGQVQTRWSLYRDTMFDNDITNDGSPFPPDDENQLPEPPTSLVLTNVVFDGEDGRPVVRVKIEWVPADEPYTTFTQIIYSQDDGDTFNELGDFQDGPAYIEVSQLGVRHVVQMWTVRASTGQISAVVEEDIIPGFVDYDIPEPTQFAWGFTAIPGSTIPNQLQFYGPIPSSLYISITNPRPNPVPTNGGQSNGTPGFTPGVRQLAYSVVRPAGESLLSPPLSVTVTGTTDDRVSLATPDQSDPAFWGQTYLRKYYSTKAGELTPFYKINHAGTATTAINLSGPIDADFTTNDLAPAEYDGVRGWAIYDAFDIPTVDPETSEMPLFRFLNRAENPHQYNRVDLSGMVKRDPTTGIPRIDAYVRVVRIDGGLSPGTRFNQLAAIAPPGSQTVVGVTDGITNVVDVSDIEFTGGGAVVTDGGVVTGGGRLALVDITPGGGGGGGDVGWRL